MHIIVTIFLFHFDWPKYLLFLHSYFLSIIQQSFDSFLIFLKQFLLPAHFKGEFLELFITKWAEYLTIRSLELLVDFVAPTFSIAQLETLYSTNSINLFYLKTRNPFAYHQSTFLIVHLFTFISLLCLYMMAAFKCLDCIFRY